MAQKWKYLVIDLVLEGEEWRVYAENGQVLEDWKNIKPIDKLLKLGEEGWELISSTRSTDKTEALYFKQPMEESQ